jgi:hypothetical protein
MSAGYLKKCSNGRAPKKQHATQEEAEGQRAQLIGRGVWTAGGSNTYFCNQCGWWHAGSLGRANRGKGRKQTAKNTPRFLATQ